MTTGPYTKQRQRYLVAERDRLRAVNAKLLAALETLTTDLEGRVICLFCGTRGGCHQDCPVSQARDAIEEAKK